MKKISIVTREGNTIEHKDLAILEFFEDGTVLANKDIPVKEITVDDSLGESINDKNNVIERRFISAMIMQGFANKISFLREPDLNSGETRQQYVERKVKEALMVTDELIKQLK